MKDLVRFINEAKKYDFQNDVITYEMIDNIKLQKKFKYKGEVKTFHFLEDGLREWFGQLTQWLNKNVPIIVKQIEKNNLDFPKELDIEFPSELSGQLHLDWDVYWVEGEVHGKLRSVEINVGRICPAGLGNARYYDAKLELERYRLPEEIKF